jgi:ATP-dependent RNA helicase SUPV3L1/SUV3
VETPAAEEPAPLAVEAIAPVVAETVDSEADEVPAAEPAPEIAATDEAPAEPEAPKVVLLWRPGRSDGGRHRHQRQGDRQGQPGGRRDRGRHQGKGGDKPADATPKEPRVLWRADDPQFQRKPRPEGERDGRNRQDGNKRRDERHEGKRRDERGDRNERRFDAPKPRDDKPQRMDPDSPFAKLAALRDQLRK